MSHSTRTVKFSYFFSQLRESRILTKFFSRFSLQGLLMLVSRYGDNSSFIVLLSFIFKSFSLPWGSMFPFFPSILFSCGWVCGR